MSTGQLLVITAVFSLFIAQKTPIHINSYTARLSDINHVNKNEIVLHRKNSKDHIWLDNYYWATQKPSTHSQKSSVYPLISYTTPLIPKELVKIRQVRGVLVEKTTTLKTNQTWMNMTSDRKRKSLNLNNSNISDQLRVNNEDPQYFQKNGMILRKPIFPDLNILRSFLLSKMGVYYPVELPYHSHCTTPPVYCLYHRSKNHLKDFLLFHTPFQRYTRKVKIQRTARNIIYQHNLLYTGIHSTGSTKMMKTLTCLAFEGCMTSPINCLTTPQKKSSFCSTTAILTTACPTTCPTTCPNTASPTTICPTTVSPTTICPTTACHTTTCPTTACPTTTCRLETTCLTTCPTTTCPTICPTTCLTITCPTTCPITKCPTTTCPTTTCPTTTCPTTTCPTTTCPTTTCPTTTCPITCPTTTCPTTTCPTTTCPTTTCPTTTCTTTTCLTTTCPTTMCPTTTCLTTRCSSTKCPTTCPITLYPTTITSLTTRCLKATCNTITCLKTTCNAIPYKPTKKPVFALLTQFTRLFNNFLPTPVTKFPTVIQTIMADCEKESDWMTNMKWLNAFLDESRDNIKPLCPQNSSAKIKTSKFLNFFIYALLIVCFEKINIGG